jgi:hypothetical protein
MSYSDFTILTSLKIREKLDDVFPEDGKCAKIKDDYIKFLEESLDDIIKKISNGEFECKETCQCEYCDLKQITQIVNAGAETVHRLIMNQGTTNKNKGAMVINFIEKTMNDVIKRIIDYDADFEYEQAVKYDFMDSY